MYFLKYENFGKKTSKNKNEVIELKENGIDKDSYNSKDRWWRNKEIKW